MTKYLSTFIINAVKKGNLKAVQRYLILHKNNEEQLNAGEEHKIGVGLFTIGDVRGSYMDHLPHLAIRYGQMEILAALVACDRIDCNRVNRDGTTPLKLAVSYRNVPAVAILLRNPKLHVDAVDFSGDTALMLAARLGSLEIVKLLLDHGADKNFKNKIGYDAANEAQAFERHAVHDYIVAYQPQALAVPASTQVCSPRLSI